MAKPMASLNVHTSPHPNEPVLVLPLVAARPPPRRDSEFYSNDIIFLVSDLAL